jgi:hypothetical protein
MRLATLVLGSLCLACGGFAVGCGANKTTNPKRETVTVNGQTFTGVRIGSVTLKTTP